MFANLLWAMNQKGVRQGDIGRILKISGATCSRKFAGTSEFSPLEKQRVCELVGYRIDWLFSQIIPPAVARIPAPGADGQALPESLRTDLLQRVGNGQILWPLNRLRATRDPLYVPACQFVIGELRRRRDIPSRKHLGFYVSGGPMGWQIENGSWSDTGEDFIQEVGVIIRHPSPLA